MNWWNSPTAKYQFAMLSAILNLVGAFLVFRSFQSTSSDFFLTSLKNGNKALCVGKNALVEWTKNGVGMGMPNACAEVTETPKVAVVTIESPTLSNIGWVLLLSGFFLQVFSLEKPKPITPPHVSYGPRQKPPHRTK